MLTRNLPSSPPPPIVSISLFTLVLLASCSLGIRLLGIVNPSCRILLPIVCKSWFTLVLLALMFGLVPFYIGNCKQIPVCSCPIGLMFSERYSFLNSQCLGALLLC